MQPHPHPLHRNLLWMLLALAAVLLSGCASTRQIATDVQSFHTGPAPEGPASYRFERLPSQAATPAQSQWETVVQGLLAAHGLQRSENQPRYAVQVSAQVQQYVDPSDLSWGGGWLHHHGPYFGGFPGPGLGPVRLWFRHSVRVVLRDLQSERVVYETIGSFDGPWNDSANLVPVILQAALRDYPNATQGMRRIILGLEPSAPENKE